MQHSSYTAQSNSERGRTKSLFEVVWQVISALGLTVYGSPGPSRLLRIALHLQGTGQMISIRTWPHSTTVYWVPATYYVGLCTYSHFHPLAFVYDLLEPCHLLRKVSLLQGTDRMISVLPSFCGCISHRSCACSFLFVAPRICAFLAVRHVECHMDDDFWCIVTFLMIYSLTTPS